MARKASAKAAPAPAPAEQPQAEQPPVEQPAAAPQPKSNGKWESAGIVAGARTPFVRSFSDLQSMDAVELAKAATAELLERTGFNPDLLDEVIMGCVMPSLKAPNLAREVVLGLDLPAHIPGMTVARACASSAQALVLAAQGIAHGDYQAVLVGGAESLSNVPVPYKKSVIDALTALSKPGPIAAKLKQFTTLKPKDLIPQAPDISELATGKSMGWHAELMAQKNGITREQQDELALASHRNAAAAWDAGKYAQEVCTVYAPQRSAKGASVKAVERDSYVRGDTSLEKLATLKPVFDKTYGSLTAGNSSGLTDGASVVLVLSESKAKELGYQPLARVVSWASYALRPHEQLLLGPAYAIPKALDRANLKLSDMDLIDLHEAFAAQVLSVIQALESKEFAQKELHRDEAVGVVDRAKLNVNGGSIALGHPFGATGTRMVLDMAHELQRRQARYAILSLCAAGGMGTAIVLERVERN